jgi:dCMP deaminase
MKDKFKKYFMSVAIMTAELSYAKRSKVGAVLVRDNRILLSGYNGTPEGTSNICEELVNGQFVTKSTVSHAEENLILYAAKKGITLENSILFITMSPCPICAKMIFGSGIKKVYYGSCYRDMTGLEYLSSVGIEHEQLQKEF